MSRCMSSCHQFNPSHCSHENVTPLNIIEKLNDFDSSISKIHLDISEIQSKLQNSVPSANIKASTSRPSMQEHSSNPISPQEHPPSLNDDIQNITIDESFEVAVDPNLNL